MRLVVALPGRELILVDDDARWLLGELAGGDDASVALAARVEAATRHDEPLRPSADEIRKLFEAFERSSHPRTRALRDLEVALHDAMFG